MEKEYEEYIEIDMLRLLAALWRRILIILLGMILCGGVGGALACFMVPAKYKASVLLHVNNSSFSVGSTSISLSDLSASKSLVNTYIVILNARLTLNDVIEQAGVNYTYEQLQKQKIIQAGAVNGTEILKITVTSKDPEEAEHIANTIAMVLPNKISQILDGSSVRTVDLAVVPEKRSSPSIRLYTLAGALIGLVFSSSIIVVRELLDDQIHDEAILHQGYHLPVLAAVPDLMASKSGKGYGSYYAAAEGKGQRISKKGSGKHQHQPSHKDEKQTFGKGVSFAASEAYRLLRTNILFALPASIQPDKRECRVVGITSSLGGEGKSTTALNLAYVLAESGRKVLLMETDMRLPTISKRLELEKSMGLSNLLAGLCQPMEVCQPSGLQEQMWVIGAGDIPPNPSELLGSEQMRSTIASLSGEFDFIILDLPPVNEVADALVASRLAQGMIMVVRQDYATRSSVAETLRRLNYVEAKMLGFVVTHTDAQGGKYKGDKSSQYSYRYHTAGKESGG